MFVSNHTFIVHEPENIIEGLETIADLWIKYGAKQCRFMDLAGSEIGKMGFIAIFDNMQQYGHCMDQLVEDDEFKNWQKQTSGTATFTRHSLERSVALKIA